MTKFLIRRLIQSIPVFIGVTLISFALIHAVPGGPTARLELDPDIKPEDIARIKANMGLDKPIWMQYLMWIGLAPNNKGEYNGLLQGDFGVSYIDQTPVSKSIMDRLPNTLNLTLPGLRGESMVIALDQHGVALSSGSACKAGSPDPTHVLLAMNKSAEEAHCAVRFSLSRTTTQEDIKDTISALGQVLQEMESTIRFLPCK